MVDEARLGLIMLVISANKLAEDIIPIKNINRDGCDSKVGIIGPMCFGWFQGYIKQRRDVINIPPEMPHPTYPYQKNPGTASTIIRERIFDGKPLILTGENGRTKKRIKSTNHKGDNNDFQKK